MPDRTTARQREYAARTRVRAGLAATRAATRLASLHGVAWLSVADAALYLGFPSPRAFRVWLQREKAADRRVPKVHWLGKRMRFRRVDLDAVVEPEAETARAIALVKGA